MDKTQNNNPDVFSPGDEEKTRVLIELFKTSYDNRDKQWEKTYFANLPDASLAIGEPRIIEGPDGYPYFHLTTPVLGMDYQSTTVSRLKKDLLLHEGIGLAINPAKETPDWVFSYGDIVNYHINGAFYKQSDKWLSRESILNNLEESVELVNPSEDILPKESRNMLRKYFASFGLDQPEIGVLQDKSNKMILVFVIEEKYFKNPEICTDFYNSLSWFLPRQYTYTNHLTINSFKQYFPL